jgi:hypothetical protein
VRVRVVRRLRRPRGVLRRSDDVRRWRVRRLGRVHVLSARHRGPRGFAAREDALDALEVHLMGPHSANEAVGSLRARWVAQNARVVRTLRSKLAEGAYDGRALRRVLERHGGGGLASRRGYDALDVLLARLFDARVGVAPPLPLEPEMVGHQPTPGREILAMVDRAAIGPRDVFYDLGSGLGRVVLLVALLTGARSIGIERDPALVAHAARAAAQLRVRGARFVHADAREGSLRGGTVYFLYTPFRGDLLRRVLERIRGESARRPLRICTLGPCTHEVAAQGLVRESFRGEEEIAVFRCGGAPQRVVRTRSSRPRAPKRRDPA